MASEEGVTLEPMELNIIHIKATFRICQPAAIDASCKLRLNHMALTEPTMCACVSLSPKAWFSSMAIPLGGESSCSPMLPGSPEQDVHRLVGLSGAVD